MSETPYQRRRQQLLDRFLAGDIDKATYDEMLAELERVQARSVEPVGPPSLSDDATRRGGAQRQYDSIGDRDTHGVRPAALAEGAELAGFRIERKLSRGGMGEVWRAFDIDGDRPVVIKVLPPELQAGADEMARVRDTFHRVHALQHQHICPIYLLRDDPRFGAFLVMKYLDGWTLSAWRRAYVAEHGDFPLAEVVRLLAPVAEALDYAHQHRVVHRDIKPQNIMVCDGGRDVQVVDFGLAAQIRTSMTRVSQVRMETSGTYPYMAPEQWRGEYQDGRTDQYALAVVAYELIADRLPFNAPDSVILERRVLTDPAPEIEDAPSAVNTALAGAMAKSRDDRFDSCAAFIETLTGRPRGAVTRFSPDNGALNAGDERRPASRAFQVGEVYTGTVVSTRSFGAYVEICPGCEGLIHISELDGGFVEKVTDVVNVGDRIQVKVIDIDDDGRIKLSRRALLDQARAQDAREVDKAAPTPAVAPLAREQIEAARVAGVEPEIEVGLGGGVSMRMVLIPSGRLLMGSPPDEKDRSDKEGPQHEVEITKPFYMGATQVTQAQWKAVTGTEPWEGLQHAKTDPGHAANYVSWNNCQDFVRRLNAVASDDGFRLPTEAEWEYACRAGSATRFYYGDDPNYARLGEYAWYAENADDIGERYAHAVARKGPNGWGLYDMHGNVWEWCQDWYQDWYGEYPSAPERDPIGPMKGNSRVVRGGSFNSYARYCRSASRNSITPSGRSSYVGFRCARTVLSHAP